MRFIEKLEQTIRPYVSICILTYILGHLVMPPDNIVSENPQVLIEFGAGAGKLAVAVCDMLAASCTHAPARKEESVIEKDSCSAARDCRVEHRKYVFCVEKLSYKHKVDNRLPLSSRVRIDLQHLSIDPLIQPAIQQLREGQTDENNIGLVGMGKHLCGVATDLALQALKNYHDGNNHIDCPIEGIAIATCCHGKCDFENCASVEWLTEVGLSTLEDFQLLTRFAGWHNNCDKVSECCDEFGEIMSPVSDTRDEETMKSLTSLSASSDNPSSTDAVALSSAEKRAFGFKCKRLIDQGRIYFIRKYLNLEVFYFILCYL